MFDFKNTTAQPSKQPTQKVTAGVLASAVVAIAAWVAGLLGFEVPAGVEASFVTVFGFIAAYLIPERT